MAISRPWYWIAGISSFALTACASAGTPPAAAPPQAQQAPALPPPTGKPVVVAEAAAPQPKIAPVDPATARKAQPIEVPKALQAIVDAKDRTDADRALDSGRHPGELLTFYGVKPGMKVAELFAGGGYTAELLARAVGPRGKVYAQNNKFVLARFAAAPWAERLKRPAMKRVVRVDRELDDPLPPEAKNLDIVFSVLFYHDTVWLGADRAKMNAAIFAALKPGGIYAVIDHSGRTGSGTGEVQTLHRIEESEVRGEIERAGFSFVEDAAFLRNPSDSRDWNDSPMAAQDRRGTSDRFALKFMKPK